MRRKFGSLTVKQPQDLKVSDDGVTITGKGEPGAFVFITDRQENIIGEGVVNSNGIIEITLKTPTDGSDIGVILQNEAGRKSPKVILETPDAGEPTSIVPKIYEASLDDTALVISGKTNPGLKIEIRVNGELVGKGVADKDGNYSVTLTKPLEKESQAEVVAINVVGTKSDFIYVSGVKDTQAPEAPTATVNPEGTEVTGKTEPNATVTVKDGETVLGSVEADKDGHYTVTLNPALTDGNTASVTATDEAKNESAPTEIVGVKDTQAPEAPTATVNPEGTEVTGKTEPNATVTVKDGDTVLGSVEADKDGHYTVTLNPALTDGNTASVTATDEAKNESAPTEIVGVKDTQAPDAPTATVNPEGTEVTGKTEPNATVTVKDGDTVLGSVEADKDGHYTVTLNPALTDGKTASVTATDEAKNESAPTVVTGQKDTQAPEAPTATVNPEGTEVSGKTEPNATVTVKDGDTVLGSVEADKDGHYTITLNPALTDGKTASVTATDEAKNESAPTEIVGVKDTQAPEAPTATVNPEGTEVTGKTEPNATVTVKDGDTVLGSVEADKDGHYTITLNPALTDGKTASVTATDEAKNESAPTVVTGQKDTQAPDAPSAEIDSITGTVMTVTAEKGSKIVVRDANQNIIGEGVGQGEQEVTINLSRPVTDNEIVSVTATDSVNNTSANTDVEGTKDTIPPAAPEVSYNNNDILTMIVKTEPNATVKVYDSNGKPKLDSHGQPILLSANDKGEATYTFNFEDRGTFIKVSSTDQSGNQSALTDSRIGVNSMLLTTDNAVDFVVTGDPTEKVNDPKLLDKGGFKVASIGLGPVLGLDLLADIFKNAVHVEVGKNEVREIDVKGWAGGVNVLVSMDLFLYKYNESTEQWEQHSVKDGWVIAPLIYGESKPETFKLDEGKWMFVLAAGEGVSALSGSGLLFSKDIVYDYNDVTNVAGKAVGNMITDLDPKFGSDLVPDNSTVTHIKIGDGEWQQTSSNGTVKVVGKFGVLLMKADGSYTYEVNKDFTQFGQKEEFTYRVTTPTGEISESKLTFDLNITSKEERIEIDNTVLLNTEAQVILDTNKSDIKPGGGFKVLELGLLGPILSADAIGGSGTMDFSVNENQVKELTLHGSVGGVTVGSVFDLFIYKLDPESGNYIQIHKETDWFFAVIGGGMSKQLTLKFGEGEYKALLQSKGGLSLLTGSGLYVDHEKVYDYNQPVKFSGEVKGDATADDSTVVLRVGDKDVISGKETIFQGQYGKLTIKADGTYTYLVEKPLNAPADWVPPYGKVDSFQLVTQNAQGQLIIDSLNIKVGIHTAQNDFDNITVEEQNVETTDTVHDKDGLGNYGTSMSKTFEIKDGAIAKDFTLSVKGDSNGSNLMTMGYQLVNKTTGKVWSFTTEFIKDAGLDIVLNGLPAGQYELTITSSDTGTIEEVNMTTNTIQTDEFVVGKVNSITGSVFENDQGQKMLDTLHFGTKQVSVNDPLMGAKTIDIQGQYGTLVVGKDGSYTYTPKGGVYGIDRFVYTTVSMVGTQETATLEINVGKNITASIYADIAESSTADDTFMMGSGGDTLLFMNNSDATHGGNGANGLDKWVDFNISQGDIIDVSQLLDGNQTVANIDQYLKFENGALFVDRLGEGNFEEMVKTAIEGDLNTILDNIKWEAPVDVTMMSSRIDLSNVEMLTADEDHPSDFAPLSISLDDLILNEVSDEVTFFNSGESLNTFEAPQVEDLSAVTSSLDVQPVVDPLDDLLNQNNSLI